MTKGKTCLMFIYQRKMRGLKSIKHAIQNWLHLKCKLFSAHDYVLENKYTEDLLKLRCKKCQKKFGVNLESAVIFSWDEDMLLSLSVYEKNLKNDARLKQFPEDIIPMKIVV